MKVLLVGNGGREHAVATAFKRSPKLSSLCCYGGARNPGILALSDNYEIGNVLDFEHIEKYTRKIKPDLAFVGPDDPIALGIADKLERLGIPTVAPKQLLARLESSKGFTRDLLRRHGMQSSSPAYQIVYSLDEAKSFISSLETDFVVKIDSLCGGKGVKVMGDHFKTIDEGLVFVDDALKGQGKVVLEEKLIGQEFSLMSYADGKNICDMPAVQDHKRAYNGDKGPNTGGMGSYSYPDILPFINKSDLNEAHILNCQVMQALEEECGEFYKGIMYGGFIATQKGVQLIEYNARFGDPECINTLAILETDFLDICLAIINQNLSELNILHSPKATVCKYLAPEGYPDNPQKGALINIGDIPDNVQLYYSSVNEKDGQIYLGSSRALALVGIDKDIVKAEKAVSEAIKNISGPLFYRSDIGTTKLIEQKIKMMEELRS